MRRLLTAAAVLTAALFLTYVVGCTVYDHNPPPWLYAIAFTLVFWASGVAGAILWHMFNDPPD